ncbi:MAG TPA: hypothetical protein VHW00_19185 [Thermoanaerobaculia bacterium]|nr:hypothetical protein [Thermoanaerobaculia bacterium]
MNKILSLLLAISVSTPTAFAACMNRFVSRTERPHQVVTLLTGKLTFQEAQELAKAISAKQAAPVEWVDDNGKTIAKQFGELKVVRPMPVGCDGRASGVVVVVTFPSGIVPTKKINVKIKDQVVAFDQQAE